MITVDDLESRWYRVVEVYALLPSALVGLLGLGVAVGGLGLSPELTGGLAMSSGATVIERAVIVSGAFALVGFFVVPPALFYDARRISAADVDWNPNPRLWLALGFLTGYAGLIGYLYYRHRQVVDWVDRDWWWLLVAFGMGAPAALLALGVPLSLLLGRNALMFFFGLSLVAAAPFPLAIYRDATHVRLNSESWQPNPGGYIGLGLFFLLLAPVSYPVLGGYYLFQRHTTVGTV